MVLSSDANYSAANKVISTAAKLKRDVIPGICDPITGVENIACNVFEDAEDVMSEMFKPKRDLIRYCNYNSVLKVELENRLRDIHYYSDILNLQKALNHHNIIFQDSLDVDHSWSREWLVVINSVLVQVLELDSSDESIPYLLECIILVLRDGGFWKTIKDIIEKVKYKCFHSELFARRMHAWALGMSDIKSDKANAVNILQIIIDKADDDDTYFDGYADINIKIDSLLSLAEFSTDVFLDCVNASQEILSPGNIRQLELSEMYLKEALFLSKDFMVEVSLLLIQFVINSDDDGSKVVEKVSKFILPKAFTNFEQGYLLISSQIILGRWNSAGETVKFIHQLGQPRWKIVSLLKLIRLLMIGVRMSSIKRDPPTPLFIQWVEFFKHLLDKTDSVPRTIFHVWRVLSNGKKMATSINFDFESNLIFIRGDADHRDLI